MVILDLCVVVLVLARAEREREEGSRPPLSLFSLSLSLRAQTSAVRARGQVGAPRPRRAGGAMRWGASARRGLAGAAEERRDPALSLSLALSLAARLVGLLSVLMAVWGGQEALRDRRTGSGEALLLLFEMKSTSRYSLNEQ
jgi:hypothetical protein